MKPYKSRTQVYLKLQEAIREFNSTPAEKSNEYNYGFLSALEWVLGRKG